ERYADVDGMDDTLGAAPSVDDSSANDTESTLPLEEAPAHEELPALEETPALAAEETHAPAAIDEEDDGPIALSLDELEGIAADAHEVTPEAPMVPLAPMDTGMNEPSLAENTDKPSTAFEEDLESATLVTEGEAVAKENEATPDSDELKSVMGYLDNLLGELPDDVIEKFAQSEYFKLYQKIMDKLGL
ncbi:MAG TPA: hypothetical protein PLY93_15245, partial [Turneriella sp.]|nr:hypothetical protein [Turneriella sp.]